MNSAIGRVASMSRVLAWAVTVAFMLPAVASADALEKLTAERLTAIRESVARLQELREEMPRTGPYQEHRANLHVLFPTNSLHALRPPCP